MTPNEVQVSGRRPPNRDRIRQVQASESVPVKWAQVTGMSGWASLAHLGSHSGNQAQVSLTVFFMPAIRAQGAVQQYPEEGCVSIRGPPRLRGHSPPFLMEAARRVAASPPTGKQPQRKRERARKGQAWEAHGVRTSGIWSRGGGGAGQADREAQVPRF